MSDEYRSVPIDDDLFDDEPVVRRRDKLLAQQIGWASIAFFICLALVIVSGLWLLLFSKSAMAMICPDSDNASITGDDRINQLLYQSLKSAILTGDEPQAHDITKLLIQAYRPNQLKAAFHERINAPESIYITPAFSISSSDVSEDTNVDDFVSRIFNSKSSAEWTKHYATEDRRKSGWIERDGWNVVGAGAFRARGCRMLGVQCTAPNIDAARMLCDAYDQCLGFVCLGTRTDCQLRVAPLTHTEQENVRGFYKNVSSLALADIRVDIQSKYQKLLLRPGSTAAQGFNFTGVCGQNGYKCVISYGLYGRNPKYGEGAIENVKLLPIHFPGWVIRIYHDDSVPRELLARLTEMGCELMRVETTEKSGNVAGMFWRFMVAQDETVDRYIIRDTDSRLNAREKAAVDEWLASGFSIHTIRDHPNHDRPLNGGMWGGSKGSLLNMGELISKSPRSGYGMDLVFLEKAVWPLIQYDQIGHDAYTCHKHPNSFPFPTKRSDDFQHVGQVFENNRPRMYDITGYLTDNPAPMQCRKRPDWIFG